MHIPVLANEVIELLNLKPGDNAVDCTLGGGGHAGMILEKTEPDGKLLGIDTDPKKLSELQAEFDGSFPNRVTFVHGNFRELEKIVHERGFKNIRAILIDLGFSSLQMDDASRGFSFQEDGPLDMRLDPTTGPTAADLLNTAPEEDLANKIWEYGEERQARAIAKQIIKTRKAHPYTNTKDLVSTVLPFYGKFKWSRRHPATKAFQAMRMWVNDELGNLEFVIPQAMNVLDTGGRLAIISFHSLEDRIIKWKFRDLKKEGRAEILTKKPIVAEYEDVKANPRARSAKLRVIIKK